MDSVSLYLFRFAPYLIQIDQLLMSAIEIDKVRSINLAFRATIP